MWRCAGGGADTHLWFLLPIGRVVVGATVLDLQLRSVLLESSDLFGRDDADVSHREIGDVVGDHHGTMGERRSRHQRIR